jgi:fermentation-respiration switch protein FrsA (DUF1100 family)
MAIFVLIMLVLVMLAVGYYFAAQIVFPKVIPAAETYQMELDGAKFNEEEFKSWPQDEVSIHSPLGYELYGLYFAMPGADKTVILTHGIGYSRYGSVKYMFIFRQRGYNILIYDLRNHGNSGGKNTTLGLREKIDLRACVDWALNRLPEGGRVGTHGESLGAATSLQHAGIDSRISFVIADCPFSDLTKELTYRISQDYHLPAIPLLPLANLICYLLTGMTFNQVSPILAIQNSTTPALFIHGMQDDYIPPKMSEDMFKAKKAGLSRLYLVPGAKHAEALTTNPAEYQRRVNAFLEEAGM